MTDQAPEIPAIEACWDAVVIGAGPAGATAATHLAQAGHRVLLLDRHVFPREKVCGDGLIADAIGALDRLGALDEVRSAAHAATTVSIFSPSRFRVDLPGNFLVLKRERLDAIVAGRAAASGAVFARGRATRVESAPGGEVVVHVDGDATPVRGRAAIIATGADTSLLVDSGLTRRTPASAIAVRCYVRSSAKVEQLIVSFDRAILPGYGWVFPVGDGEYNVGCGLFRSPERPSQVNLREVFARFKRSFPIAVEVMAGAHGETALRGAPLRCGLSPVPLPSGVPVVIVGETIHATFPFTGEGIGKAMETGELAAEAVHETIRTGDCGAIEQFPALVNERLRPRYLGYVKAERWLGHRWVNDLVARLTERSPFLRQAAAGILNETVDPNVVFSKRGLWIGLRDYIIGD